MKTDIKKTNKVMFTISSLNYMHYSLNVRKSFLEYNPGWDFVIFMMDELTSQESLKMVRDLINQGIDIRSFLELKNLVPFYPIEEMLNRYSVLEINTAIKPFALEYLMKSGYDKVVYIDPDIQFFAPITKLDKLLDDYDIILTPHMMHPYPEDGKQQECQTIMKAGMYNCGFFAVRNTENGLNCVRFWQQKLRHKCYVDTAAALFTDQRWADWFPCLFDKVCIFKDYGYNTAYWNLHERTVTNRKGKWYSNDEELVFYHFSGLNRKNMDLISKYQDRYKLSDRKPDLKKLFTLYLDNVNSNMADDFVKFHYFGTNVRHTNYEIPNKARNRVFWKQRAFANDKNQVLESVRTYAKASRKKPWFIKFQSGYGINVIGYLYDMHSIGVVMRAFVDDLLASGIPVSLYVLESGSAKIPEQEQEKYKAFVTKDPSFPVNLIIVNADQMENLYKRNPKLFKDKYNIANWSWEFEDGFDIFADAKKYLDKVIVSTEHMKTGIEKATGKDFVVEKFNYPYRHYTGEIIPVKDVRKKYGLNTKDYLFFFNFDYNSSYARKNPEAILHAFQKALPTQKDAKLVIKTSNLANHDQEHKMFMDLADKLKIKNRIVVIDEFLSKVDMMSLINACDAYISLHHAEGLGLGMIEAMDLGKPVVATKYSGNLDFMNDKNSLLVSTKVTKTHIDFPQYKNVTIWGEPDVKQASDYIKKLYKDPKFGVKLGKAAKESIQEKFSLVDFDKDIYNLMLSATIQNKTQILIVRRGLFYLVKRLLRRIFRKK